MKAFRKYHEKLVAKAVEAGISDGDGIVKSNVLKGYDVMNWLVNIEDNDPELFKSIVEIIKASDKTIDRYESKIDGLYDDIADARDEAREIGERD